MSLSSEGGPASNPPGDDTLPTARADRSVAP